MFVNQNTFKQPIVDKLELVINMTRITVGTSNSFIATESTCEPAKTNRTSREMLVS